MCNRYVPRNDGNKGLGAIALKSVDNSMKVHFPPKEFFSQGITVCLVSTILGTV